MAAKIPALFDKSGTANGGDINHAGGVVHNDFGGTVMQTDAGIINPVVVSGTGASDGSYRYIVTPPPVLTSIVVSGPATAAGESTAQYTCTGHYDDTSTDDLTLLVAWSEDGTDSSIDSSGLLTVGVIDAEEVINVTAEYETFSDSLPVTLEPAAPPIDLTAFVSTWETTTASETLEWKISGTGTSAGTMLWETIDGTTVVSVPFVNATELMAPQTMGAAGLYRCTITGTIAGVSFENTGIDRAKIRTIENYGNVRFHQGFYGAFQGCSGLTSLTVGSSDVTGSMSHFSAFRDCAALINVDFTGLGLSFTDLGNCFRASGLTELNVEPMDLSVCTSMSGMFAYCTLTSVSYNQMWADFLAKKLAGNIPDSLAFGGGGSVATGQGLIDRNIMRDTYGWTITDGTP